MPAPASNVRPAPDAVLTRLADYAAHYRVRSPLALETARLALIDSLGCGFEALSYPDCTKLLGPIVPGTIVPNGSRIPGTPYVVDPERAAFYDRCYREVYVRLAPLLAELNQAMGRLESQ